MQNAFTAASTAWSSLAPCWPSPAWPGLARPATVKVCLRFKLEILVCAAITAGRASGGGAAAVAEASHLASASATASAGAVFVICVLAVQFEPRAVATNGQLAKFGPLMTGANKII